ncbi:hypothetical protein B9G38_11385 [Halorubrum sp. SD612]|nr:hypothetical protein B9G38_11385 [Halorubrum sp. SD612]
MPASGRHRRPRGSAREGRGDRSEAEGAARLGRCEARLRCGRVGVKGAAARTKHDDVSTRARERTE